MSVIGTYSKPFAKSVHRVNVPPFQCARTLGPLLIDARANRFSTLAMSALQPQTMKKTRFALMAQVSLRGLFSQVLQLRDDPVDLIKSIVMNRRHPDDAVRVTEIERFHQPF